MLFYDGVYIFFCVPLERFRVLLQQLLQERKEIDKKKKDNKKERKKNHPGIWDHSYRFFSVARRGSMGGGGGGGEILEDSFCNLYHLSEEVMGVWGKGGGFLLIIKDVDRFLGGNWKRGGKWRGDPWRC